MQPLIGDKYSSRKYGNRKSLCIVSWILLFAAILIVIVYFSSSSVVDSDLNRNFMEKPDNDLAYPSDIIWKDPLDKKPPKPGDKPPPKLGVPIPGVPLVPLPPSDGGEYIEPLPPLDWWYPPPGTDGATIDGITYGGDDVTTIQYPDDFQVPTDGEVAKDPQYPTKVTTVDKDRVIIKSDTSKASIYYKSNGADDIISYMPYLIESSCSASTTNCGFKQYSGYLLGNNNVEIHYWFIEAEEEPMNKPVFFWTNGGPGCSAMDGLLTEHGPWRVTDNLEIEYNPYSWNNEVNIVYLEQPYGVGFSSITNAADNVVSGDQNAADDMDAAIRNWLNKFPDYKNNKIYLSSESWGGHYVPITSYTILQNNDVGVTPKINFGGFFVGNPYTDFYENAYGFIGDIYGHGLMKSADWDTWRSSCWGNEYNIDNLPICSEIYARAYVSAYNANVYALDYPQCYDDMDWELELLNRPEPSYWLKDAHIHHAARAFMEILLAHHDYDYLKMSLQKSELQQLHEIIAQKLELQYDEIPPPPPPQGGQSQIPQQPVSGQPVPGQPAPGQPAQGMPAQGQPVQSQPVQGMPDQPKPKQSKPKPKKKVPSGVEHDRPNHNLGDKALAGTQKDDKPDNAEDNGNTNDNLQEYGDGYLPCIEYDMADYLNLLTVQSALHVKPSKWQMCSDTVWNAWPEEDYDTKIEAFYSEIIDNYLVEYDLKLSVYSGDDDSVCGLQGTQYWLDRWKYKINTNTDWQTWKDDDNQLGGFYTQYMTDDDNNIALHFITVRSAGHMVPTTQPSRALNILKKYLYEFKSS